MIRKDMTEEKGLDINYGPRSLAKQGDNAIAHVRPSVRPFVGVFVCLSELSCLNRFKGIIVACHCLFF